jgi:hypothetical protein
MSDTKRGRFADLVDAIHGWWTKRGDSEPEGRKVGEEITRLLPEPVNGTEAVKNLRKKKKMLDEAVASGDDD